MSDSAFSSPFLRKDEGNFVYFATISSQKHNSHLKEAGTLADMTENLITEKQSGQTKIRNIRAVTGHTTADMMMKYVKFDDESKREKISILNENAQSGVETVFDHAITYDERIRRGLPTP